MSTRNLHEMAWALPDSSDPVYQYHERISAMTRKKLAPAVAPPKPEEPPQPPSVAVGWETRKVCTWLERTLVESYGEKGYHVVHQLQHTFEEHFIDGATLLKLQLVDWQTLCPRVFCPPQFPSLPPCSKPAVVLDPSPATRFASGLSNHGSRLPMCLSKS